MHEAAPFHELVEICAVTYQVQREVASHVEVEQEEQDEEAKRIKLKAAFDKCCSRLLEFLPKPYIYIYIYKYVCIYIYVNMYAPIYPNNPIITIYNPQYNPITPPVSAKLSLGPSEA